jgi:PAS domain S-box-containing protein
MSKTQATVGASARGLFGRLALAFRGTAEPDEAHAALRNRERLLSASNRTAEILLTATGGGETSVDALHRAMHVIGDALDVDRVQIWRNEERAGKVYFSKRYEWLSPYAATLKNSQLGQRISHDGMPGWYEVISGGGRVNSTVDEMPLEERVVFSQYDVQSLALLPLVVDGEIIGHVNADDCRNVRTFEEVEMDFLASASLMLANFFEKIINREEGAVKERLRGMVDSSPFICFVFDRDGAVVDVNQAAVEFFGFTDKQGCFEHFYKLNPPYQPDGTHSETVVKANILRLLESGEGYTSEWMHQSITGEPRPVEVTLTPIKIAGEDCIIAHTRDLRERNALRETMARLEEALQDAGGQYDGE